MSKDSLAIDPLVLATALRKLAEAFEVNRAKLISLDMDATYQCPLEFTIIFETDEPWWSWDASNALPQGRS